MRDARLEPDVINYGLGMSVRKNRGQWRHALSLLFAMREARVERCVVSYSSGMSACANIRQWQRAPALSSAIQGGDIEARRHQLHYWDRRVREGWAVAAG